jgi:hypothetical protein
LLGDLKTFDGTFAPRVIRGTTRTLSAHALGIALDINVPWNALGRAPAAGSEGSVLRLIPIFERHGFAWGGSSTRPDGSHFEFADRDRLGAEATP